MFLDILQGKKSEICVYERERDRKMKLWPLDSAVRKKQQQKNTVLSLAHRKYSSSNPVMDTSSAPQLVKMFSYNNLIQKHFYKARVINFN